MRRFSTFLAALLLAGAYSASACSSDEPKKGGSRSGGRAGAAGSSSGQAGVTSCLPRACCRDGVVTTTYGACMQLTSSCTLGCRADLPVMGCVTTNSLGGEQEAMTFAQSVCVPDPNAGTGGVAGSGTGGIAGGGMGGEGGASEGGAGGEGGASEGGMGGEGGR